MFARTERLLLRPGWIEDAPALARWLSEDAVARNLARVPSPCTPADAERHLSCGVADALPSLLIFARTQRAPRLIGGIGLDRGESGVVELGYWIARPYWGLGFATEAGSAMVALAHHSLRIKRLVAVHSRDNPASARVLRKLGFKAIGALPCRLFARNAGDAVREPGARAMAA